MENKTSPPSVLRTTEIALCSQNPIQRSLTSRKGNCTFREKKNPLPFFTYWSATPELQQTWKKKKQNKNKTKQNLSCSQIMRKSFLREFSYRLVTVTQISSDGEVTKRWTGFTCCPSTRWNLNCFTRTDRKTNPSAIENRQPGHLRFPAKPNGW